MVSALEQPVAAWLDREQTLTVWRLGQDQPALVLPAAARAEKSLRDDAQRCRPSGQVIDFALSPNGKYLAVGGIDRLLKVWEIDRGKEPRLFQVPPWAGWTNVWTVAFTSDSRRLAAGGIRPIVWDVEQGQPVQQYHGTNELTCSSLAFNKDGSRLAACYRDGQVRVWDTSTGKTVLAPRKAKLQVTSVAFSPEGRQLAWTHGRDVGHRLPGAPPESFGRMLRGPASKAGDLVPALWSLAYSPDGRSLASRSATEVVLWDRDTGQRRWQASLQQVVAREVPLTFTPDGQYLVTGGKGGRLQAWRADSGEQASLPIPAQNTRCHAFAPLAAGLLATSDGGNSVVLWEAAGRRKLTLEDAGVGEVWGLTFAPDGQRLAVCGSLGTVKVWTWKGAQPRATVYRGHTRSVWCVAFSPDGRRLVTGGGDETVRLWDVATTREIFTLPGHGGTIAGVTFSPDGQRVASCGVDGMVRLWDARTGYELLALNSQGYVTGVVFSPDGRELASCSHDGAIRIWDGTPVSE